MKILFVISEVESFAKTGGLADVGKALPLALKALGHDVRIIKPYYQEMADNHPDNTAIIAQNFHHHGHDFDIKVRELHLDDVPLYCIDYPPYFAREGLYTDGYQPFGDNAQRFAFFSLAALEVSKWMNFQPDVVHCHDWHTALACYFLSRDNSGFFDNTSSLLTIHNGAFQGNYNFADIPLLHGDHELAGQLDNGHINFMRIGIRYASKINAVSPNYAKELLTSLGSHHLDIELVPRSKDLSGILNGCDYQQWDPATDPLLPTNYDVDDMVGKADCKAELQARLKLPDSATVPVIGMVCRLADQKGFGYLLPILEDLLQHNVQLLIVGTGDPSICDVLSYHAKRYPHKLAFFNGFDNELAHLIEAGSDFFLMPSLYEPCGLNQMYSLAYATIPIVRAVGGLKDTVLDLQALPEHATGFMFAEPDSKALLQCLRRALLFYWENPEGFAQMQRRAMGQKFTWHDAGLHYEALYRTMNHG